MLTTAVHHNALSLYRTSYAARSAITETAELLVILERWDRSLIVNLLAFSCTFNVRFYL